MFFSTWHLVLPALNLTSLNAGILTMMQQVRLMMFSLFFIVSYLIIPVSYFILSRFIEEVVSEAKSSGMVDTWIREFGVEGKLSTPE